MSKANFMNLKIFLPFGVFLERSTVLRIVAEGIDGSFGLLPQRLDCAAALPPGILIYEAEGAAEVYVAVDQGILVKTGENVTVSVRRAIGGTDLKQLRTAVQNEFKTLNEQEQIVRQLMSKIEISLIRRLTDLHHD